VGRRARGLAAVLGARVARHGEARMSARDSFEGVELVEPDHTRDYARGNFRQRYAITGDNLPKNRTGWRLMDLCLAIAESDDAEYFADIEAGEFSVVDVVTKQKAWFEMPYGCTADQVTGMVSSHFNASAFRVGEKMWFV
jgi:hypothetical protein